jgi:anti-sigma-K factor RskA
MTDHRPPGSDDQVHTLIGPYVLDALDDAERAAVTAHLANCPGCAAEVAELRATAARLADPTAADPPRGLRDAVLAAAHRTRQEPPQLRGRQPGTHRWRRWVGVAAAAVVLVVAAVVVTYVVQQRRIDEARRTAAVAAARQQRIDAILSAPDATVVPARLPGGARGRLVLSRQRDLGVVTLSGLPRLSGRHTYQLWLVAGGTPRNAGVLPVGTAGASRVLTGVRSAGAFAISTEPAGGSSRPTHLWATVPLSR